MSNVTPTTDAERKWPKTRGQVYLATADGYRTDFLKIGFTKHHTSTRMSQLNNSSGQGAKGYRILARFYVKHPRDLEQKLHKYFADDRQDTSREWFNNMSVEQFYEVITKFACVRDLKLLRKRLDCSPYPGEKNIFLLLI
ncbi:GIY-YIG nuclease family protein [Celerinatantimonas diazotrophica]|uniref:T5orf172 domain-containing protein n=1 Tax=Celerinatantimonas diazotrophica TaxID=412034 RepID=A0A4V2PR67_9GAMM|nr:GIY-YIG nuclease family protein [Celerinatantimonas diazotrophica]TCK57751.1 T5orf172 domain-containing protein [Celerinatantimonas diazotrophica]CAG9298187.1 hypothetical protein CEDIAZO_03382 [Celerinatantimonas diazotrophica]